MAIALTGYEGSVNHLSLEQEECKITVEELKIKTRGEMKFLENSFVS
jgi:hypothetical protein